MLLKIYPLVSLRLTVTDSELPVINYELENQNLNAEAGVCASKASQLRFLQWIIVRSVIRTGLEVNGQLLTDP